jgi:exodeoxyribonuclease VII large subunit
LEVCLVPVKVQGKGAAEEIAGAIATLNAYQNTLPRGDFPIDALVLTRGGGSLEDLWAFNEEVTVRAVAASSIPIVSAVGHEIDVSLCDLAADLRALTPTEAAQRIAPETQELRSLLGHQSIRLDQAVQAVWKRDAQRLESLDRRALFHRPLDLLVHARAESVDLLEVGLEKAWERDLERRKAKIGSLAGRLDSLSPLDVLQRGYSVTLEEKGGVIRSVDNVRPAEKLKTRLHDGTITSRVEQVDRTPSLPASEREEDPL